MNPYLCLDAVEAATPKHGASLNLHLILVDLILDLPLLRLVFRDLVLLCVVTRRPQELRQPEAAGGDACDQLRGGPTQILRPCQTQQQHLLFLNTFVA